MRRHVPYRPERHELPLTPGSVLRVGYLLNMSATGPTQASIALRTCLNGRCRDPKRVPRSFGPVIRFTGPNAAQRSAKYGLIRSRDLLALAALLPANRSILRRKVTLLKIVVSRVQVPVSPSPESPASRGLSSGDVRAGIR